MTTLIKPGELLAEDACRRVEAALALEGLDRKRWAEKEGISYGRLNRMLQRVEVPSAQYAARLNALVRRAFRPVRGIAA